MANIIEELGTTLDEYLLVPGHIGRSTVLDVDIGSPLTACRKGEEPALKLPTALMSSPMQAVYSTGVNIELAKLGGMAISNWSQPSQEQAAKRRRVKDYKAGFVKPDVVRPDMTIAELITLSDAKGYHTFPVTEDGTLGTRMVGIITSNDYHQSTHGAMTVGERMTPTDQIVFAYDTEIRNDLTIAQRMLINHRRGNLPILATDGRISSIVFRKDIDHHTKNPNEFVDKNGRYMGGDAINTSDYAERAPQLVEAGTDFLYIVTSQAHSDYVKETLDFLKNEFPHIPAGAGNTVTADGFKFLVQNGAQCVGVGMGPGSICITQEQIGVGMPQATAIRNVAAERDRYTAETGIYVPIIADGGINNPRRALVTYALGADIVMGGRIFAGTEEGPSEKSTDGSKKAYWGEGSPRARKWMEMRYGHSAFDEGVETWVPYVGRLNNHMGRFVYTIQDGSRKAGCMSIPELHNAALQRMSPSAIAEMRAMA
ncbi:MAG TPA: IMP dehydrogenase [archaeon]|nr:IMP dehydrogenase [archaeon]